MKFKDFMISYIAQGDVCVGGGKGCVCVGGGGGGGGGGAGREMAVAPAEPSHATWVHDRDILFC